MSYAPTFKNIRLPVRLDGVMWASIRVFEQAAQADPVGPLIDTVPSSAWVIDPKTGLLGFTAHNAQLSPGWYRFQAIGADGALGDLSAPELYPDPSADFGFYSTPELLRAELEAEIGDEAAAEMLVKASDAVDALLGFWRVDETSGRKIAQADVAVWQWAKLGRATVLLAARMQANPELLSAAQYSAVRGPDFWFTDRRAGDGGRVGSDVLALLNDSGLRRLTGRAVPGRRGRNPQDCFGTNLDLEYGL